MDLRQVFLLGLMLVCTVVISLNIYGSSAVDIISYAKAVTKANPTIGIIIVLEPNTSQYYTRALDSFKCYCKIHGYEYIVADTGNYREACPHKDKFFRRHCVSYQFLPKVDYLMFVDADIGVVNPKRKVEEFIDPEIDVIFYDRFYNQEIMAGAYILKNTPYSLDFIKGWADYEYKLPKSFHGTDNGALHAYIASKVFEKNPEEYRPCMEIYNRSNGYDSLFVYEACIRAALGFAERFPHIKILRKGTGWARDSWLSNSLWNPNKDFMLHSWKTRQLQKYNSGHLPIRPTHHNTAAWYDPIVGDFDFDKCNPGNTTWNYDQSLISTSGEIDTALAAYREQIRRDYYKRLAQIPAMLQY